MYHIHDRSSLDTLGTRLHLDSVLMGNLRQMCNCVDLGKDGRSSSKKACDWMLLNQVRWVVREGSDIMHPAIGSNINIHKSVPGLSELSSDQLKQLLAAISADRRASGSGSISPQLLKSLATVRCSSACAAGRQRGVWEAPWEAVEPAATR